MEEGPAAGYQAESEGFAELGMTSESKALKSIFFGQVRCEIFVVVVLAWLYFRMNARRIGLASLGEKQKILLSLEQVSWEQE